MAAKANTPAPAPEVQEAPAAEKKVKIILPLTKTERAPVYVSVNNRSWLIQRGVEVEVPECVVEVLRHQDEMMMQIYAFEDAHVKG